MPNEGTNIKHESFGMLQINRISNSPSVHLFGSSIPHSNTIRLRIAPAELMRTLNRDWYHASLCPLVEIEMSYTQFAEAITSLNTEGVPCTLRYVNGKRMADCPFVSKREQFEQEFAAKLQELAGQLDALQQMATDLVDSKTTTKAERKAVLDKVNRIHMEISANLPFTARQFNEQMDKTTLEAKGEFEAWVQSAIHSLGLKALQAEEFKLIGEGKEAPPHENR